MGKRASGFGWAKKELEFVPIKPQINYVPPSPSWQNERITAGSSFTSSHLNNFNNLTDQINELTRRVTELEEILGNALEATEGMSSDESNTME